MDLHTLNWDEEILQILGIPRQILPRIVPSSDSKTWGVTLKDGPLGAGIPLCGALGDQQAALVTSFYIARLFGNVALKKIVRNQKTVEFIRHAGEKKVSMLSFY